MLSMEVTQPRVDGKKVRKYTLKINEGNTLWMNITGSSVNYNENLIKL